MITDERFTNGPVRSIPAWSHFIGRKVEGTVDMTKTSMPGTICFPDPVPVNKNRTLEPRLARPKAPAPAKERRKPGPKPKHDPFSYTISIPVEELVAMLKTRTVREVAKELSVIPTAVYVTLREACCTLPSHVCRECGQDCGRTSRTWRCDTCRSKRKNGLSVENRKKRFAADPQKFEEYKQYHAQWKRDRRKKLKEAASEANTSQAQA